MTKENTTTSSSLVNHYSINIFYFKSNSNLIEYHNSIAKNRFLKDYNLSAMIREELLLLLLVTKVVVVATVLDLKEVVVS